MNNQNLTHEQKSWIKELQKTHDIGKYNSLSFPKCICNKETGEIFKAREGECGGIYEGEFLGNIPMKMIPYRRKNIKTRKETKLKKIKLEKMLEKGMEIIMTPKEVNRKIADKFNLHINQPYRMIISGINPLDTLTFDGIMTKLNIFADKKGFAIKELILENGLTYDAFSEKTHFDKEVFNGNYRQIGFGRIMDEKGFTKLRDEKKNDLITLNERAKLNKTLRYQIKKLS